MAIDRLSEVLDFIEVRSVVSGGFAVSGTWEARTAVADELKFFAMVRGRARLETDGVPEPVDLEAGDVAVLNARSWLLMTGGAGDGQPIHIEPPSDGSIIRHHDSAAEADDIGIGGRVDLNAAGKELLLQSLPPVAHVRASSGKAPHLRGTVHRLFNEIVANRAGSDFAVRQYGQLLLLDVLRAFMGEADVPAGWLKVLADEQLRPALTVIHSQPAKAWRLEDLAREATMSRTTFAERFRDVAGVPPLTYLINWRMLLARRALAGGDTSVRSLAFELGYSSESAFSSAFKRKIGESPLNYRSRARRDLRFTPPVGAESGLLRSLP